MKQYIEIQPKSWKKLYQFYKENNLSSLPKEDQEAKVSEYLQQIGFSTQ